MYFIYIYIYLYYIAVLNKKIFIETMTKFTSYPTTICQNIYEAFKNSNNGQINIKEVIWLMILLSN